jgi:hypothetical protein
MANMHVCGVEPTGLLSDILVRLKFEKDKIKQLQIPGTTLLTNSLQLSKHKEQLL